MVTMDSTSNYRDESTPHCALRLESCQSSPSRRNSGLGSSDWTRPMSLLHRTAERSHGPRPCSRRAWSRRSRAAARTSRRAFEIRGIYRQHSGTNRREDYDTIEQVCAEADAVLIESVDGRPHLEEARRVNVGEETTLHGQAAGGDPARRAGDFPLGRGGGRPDVHRLLVAIREEDTTVRAGDSAKCRAPRPRAPPISRRPIPTFSVWGARV